jgi:hypothetical protein
MSARDRKRQQQGPFAGIYQPAAHLPGDGLALVLAGSAAALTADSETHAAVDQALVPHPQDPDLLLDRFDARLLLDSLRGLDTATSWEPRQPEHWDAASLEPGVTAAELQAERYADLDPAREHLLSEPYYRGVDGAWGASPAVAAAAHTCCSALYAFVLGWLPCERLRLPLTNTRACLALVLTIPLVCFKPGANQQVIGWALPQLAPAACPLLELRKCRNGIQDGSTQQGVLERRVVTSGGSTQRKAVARHKCALQHCYIKAACCAHACCVLGAKIMSCQAIALCHCLAASFPICRYLTVLVLQLAIILQKLPHQLSLAVLPLSVIIWWLACCCCCAIFLPQVVADRSMLCVCGCLSMLL